MRKGFFRIVLFAMAALLSASPVFAAPAAPAKNTAAGTGEIDLEQYASEVLRLTNLEREKAGVSALSFDDEALQKTSAVRAAEIMSLCSHKRPNGKNWYTAYHENEVKFRAAAENIAFGQSTPEEVMEAWMSSPGHKKNITNKAYTKMGISVMADSEGRLYWAQNFAG